MTHSSALPEKVGPDRSGPSEEADISPFIALRRNGEWQLPELHTVPNAGHYAFLAPCTESLRQEATASVELAEFSSSRLHPFFAD